MTTKEQLHDTMQTLLVSLGPVASLPGCDDCIATALPAWLARLLDRGEVEIHATFSSDSWGSPGFVDVALLANCDAGSLIRDRLHWWQAEDEPERYTRFCDQIAQVVWAAIEQSPHYDTVDQLAANSGPLNRMRRRHSALHWAARMQ